MIVILSEDKVVDFIKFVHKRSTVYNLIIVRSVRKVDSFYITECISSANCNILSIVPLNWFQSSRVIVEFYYNFPSIKNYNMIVHKELVSEPVTPERLWFYEDGAFPDFLSITLLKRKKFKILLGLMSLRFRVFVMRVQNRFFT